MPPLRDAVLVMDPPEYAQVLFGAHTRSALRTQRGWKTSHSGPRICTGQWEPWVHKRDRVPDNSPRTPHRPHCLNQGVKPNIETWWWTLALWSCGLVWDQKGFRSQMDRHIELLEDYLLTAPI
jgi:hypothetical protein